MREVTPPQTVGPFFHGSLLGQERSAIASEGTDGDRVRIRGRILDGGGKPVDDAMVEIWQANAHGRYRHPADGRDVPLDETFIGFGRAGTVEGEFVFRTIRPGAVPSPDGGWQASHLNVLVFARGLLDRLATRIYFEDDPAIEADDVLRSVPEDRRGTLLARRDPQGGPGDYRFDVVLQGERETVFFDL
jgi:protocatechuate 3,4-dioxygenase alpha subunit